jgi:hypothetical protein
VIAVLEYRGWGWPDNPLDAAAEFLRKCVPEVREYADMSGLAADIAAHHPTPSDRYDGVIIALPHADYTHEEWRQSAIRQLARECAPMLVNGIAAAAGENIRPVLDYLKSAPGVTGQMLRTDGNSCTDR